ncbi:MAG: Clp protease N-terminal domain-containing protein [Actinomycetota bacterium]
MAGAERQRRRHGQLSHEHLLLGVLRNAQDPLERPRCFNNRGAPRRRAAAGPRSACRTGGRALSGSSSRHAEPT